ncbi:ERVV2 protein, partial [Xiphorhynchus elegans]|nr:ERVV2 protein [Xiphorhynchus elegans]
TWKERGLCAVIKQSCCSYVSQDHRIEKDLQTMVAKMNVLRQVALYDTSWGFTILWNKLTSWLPNLAWLKTLIGILTRILISVFLIFLALKCFFRCYGSTGSTYIDWKRNQLRQKLESYKYFEKK